MMVSLSKDMKQHLTTNAGFCMGHETEETHKHGSSVQVKVQLNNHGGQQIQGIHSWDTYALVVTWFAIR